MVLYALIAVSLTATTVSKAVSALATVGVTTGATSSLSIPAQCLIILFMYFGRVGPMSLAIALNIKQEPINTVKNPTENITVG